MKLYKKKNLLKQNFISWKFTILKIHKNSIICDRGPNSYAPQPTSFPNHHTVVGDTIANFNLHQLLISFLYMIPSCKQY